MLLIMFMDNEIRNAFTSNKPGSYVSLKWLKPFKA